MALQQVEFEFNLIVESNEVVRVPNVHLLRLFLVQQSTKRYKKCLHMFTCTQILWAIQVWPFCAHNVHLVSLLGTAKYKMVQKVFAYVYL